MKFLKKPVVTQPESLRLADRLEKYLEIETNNQAAAELRRLHEENQMLIKELKTIQKVVKPWTIGPKFRYIYDITQYALRNEK